MEWGSELWDQYDIIDRQTQWGIDLIEKYVKFVKDRTEIEQSYAKQLRTLVKKYSPKRVSKEDHEMKFSQYQAFINILNELNDYAGQREIIAENLMQNIFAQLLKYLHENKQERKMHLLEGRKAQQNLETSFKQLDNAKRRFERDCKEAEKAMQNAEKADNDINATKADVEKAKQQANLRNHMVEESKNEYASQLQKYNKDQNQFYFVEMPHVFNKLQEMDEKRIQKLCEAYKMFADTERQVMPIIGKCLDGMTKAAESVNESGDSQVLIEAHKSGFERPGELEFEDYSQMINRTSSENSIGSLKSEPKTDHRTVGKSKTKRWPFGKKNKLIVSEDFSHLPPEQRRKKLQQKIEDLNKELQKQVDQSEALDKMKDVYQRNPQMGDPNSLEPRIMETNQQIDRLRNEIQKYEMWLADAEAKLVSRNDSYVQYTPHCDRSPSLNNNGSHDKESPDTTYSDDSGQEPLVQPSPVSEFDDFEDDLAHPIGSSTALYPFDGNSEGTIPMAEGEVLQLIEEDKGDGWTRVRRSDGEEGYVPTSYVKITLSRK
ncbi:cdc42-interacting protein 4 homolog isoform X2 [Hemiscyllium ocellatum]|uniref:cdc42-interacting protein 4 homolog isoform X2 n=1 Tax=Hemiscyllium ocellatum TaxID=170820 RepID=UPI002966045A|nr:cdc42-interacting protein 4 homolog isoform X2 [Hemiscyllium ocellatum]